MHNEQPALWIWITTLALDLISRSHLIFDAVKLTSSLSFPISDSTPISVERAHTINYIEK